MSLKKKLLSIGTATGIAAASMGMTIVAAPAANAAPASQCKMWTEDGGSGYAYCAKGDPYRVEIECRTWSVLMGWQHKKVRGAWVTRGNLSQAHCSPSWHIFEGRIAILRA